MHRTSSRTPSGVNMQWSKGTAKPCWSNPADLASPTRHDRKSSGDSGSTSSEFENALGDGAKRPVGSLLDLWFL